MGQGGDGEIIPSAGAPLRNASDSSKESFCEDEISKIQRPLPQIPRYDRLTVFQAAPLVWKDQDENLHTVEMLDFDREREILTESLKEAQTVGAEIELVFETATTDRLGAFLAASETQVLHFTCHGSPEYLAIEDGSGGAQFLRVDDLRELMSAGNGELLFVFVSACYSRAAGEAFLEAGASHVVCCQHDEPLMDLAAQEFSRTFYFALACGRNLIQSFELGKQAVRLCPQIPNATNEMGKFLLLPEDGDHDVPIFFTKPRKCSFGMKPSHPLSSWILPPPPEVFVGREMEMYRVIQNLWRSRLVRLTGCAGSGKVSVGAAVARYISVRERTFALFDEVIWLPLIYTTRIDKLSSCFYELFALLQDEGLAVSLQLNEDYRRVCGTIIEALYQTKALLVMETKVFLETQSMNKLSIFLQDLFRGTKYVRVILICQQGFEISLRNSVVESEVVVDPLDFEATATLFGRLCPYVSDRRCSRACTPRQLSNLLVPKGKGDVKVFSQRKSLSKRCVDIFRMIGDGVPSKIHVSARVMTPQEYDRLIEIGERIEYNSDCTTRVELEIQLERLGEDLQVAVREQNFQRAKEIQVALDELDRQREALPEIEELRRMAVDLKEDLDNAVSQTNFNEAENLSQQLDLVNTKIAVEQEALLLYDKDCKPSSESAARSNEQESEDDHFATRAGLESEIRKLQNELEEAVKKRDFPNCRHIQALIDDFSARRESLPSLEELSLKITAFNVDLEAAVAARDFAEAESIHRQIQQLEERVASEKESEENFVAATAIRLGKHLSKLGEELQEAVNDQNTLKAKEIESCLRKEIKELEERFTLCYTARNSPDDSDRTNSGVHESDLGTGTDWPRGREAGSQPEKKLSDSSSPLFSERTSTRRPTDEVNAKGASTVAAIPSSDTTSGRNEETRPGAVAVPGANTSQDLSDSLVHDSFVSSLHDSASRRDDGTDENDYTHLRPARARTQSRDDQSEKYVSRSSAEGNTSDERARSLQERFDRGLCPTCSGRDSPTQCFVFKKSRNDPQVRTRIPLSVEGLVYEGKCLICNPGAGQRVSHASDDRLVGSEIDRRNGTLESDTAFGVPAFSSSVPAAAARVGSEQDSDPSPALEIAVATRVDAVAQEDAIERLVRDAIRRVAEGSEEVGEAIRASGEAVGRIVADDQRILDLGPNAHSDLANATQSNLNGTNRKPKKIPFLKGLGKFGKRKKDS